MALSPLHESMIRDPAAFKAALGIPDFAPIQGRLSLIAGVSVPETDVATASTVYFVPTGGRNVILNLGSAMFAGAIPIGLSLALTSNNAYTGYQQANSNYDAFAILVGDIIRLGTGPAWAAGAVAGSATARGTGAGSTELEEYNGLLVNKNDITIRYGNGANDFAVVPARRATYLGSIRTVGAGETCDTKLKRFVYNAHNRSERLLRVRDPVTTYSYNGSLRQVNGNAANQVEFILGLTGTLVSGEASLVNANGDTALYFNMGIGIDSIVALAEDGQNSAGFWPVANKAQMNRASYRGYPGLGYHRLTWLESGPGSGTVNWYSGDYKSGLTASYLG